MFWAVIYYCIVQNGTSVTTNTLKMVGVWLIFTFIIPAVIHQYVTIQHPPNLMTDFIEVSRDKKNDLYDQADITLKQMLIELFPEVSNAKISIDSKQAQRPLNESRAALANDLFKQSIQIIEANNKVKNVSLTIKKKGRNCLFTRTIWCWKNYYSQNNCRSTKS